MKLTLLEDYLVGSRIRPKGSKIDTDRELGEILVVSGIAQEEGKKKKITNRKS